MAGLIDFRFETLDSGRCWLCRDDKHEPMWDATLASYDDDGWFLFAWFRRQLPCHRGGNARDLRIGHRSAVRVS
jgi:hypothetical protein